MSRHCPHCGGALEARGYVRVPWAEVDALLRDASVRMVDIATEYGCSTETLRVRRKKLGIAPKPGNTAPPPPPPRRIPRAEEVEAILSLREGRARLEAEMAALREAVARLGRAT